MTTSETYIEALHRLAAEASTEADADPTAVINADAIAEAIAAGLLRPEDLQGPDPIRDDEYAAAQRWRHF